MTIEFYLQKQVARMLGVCRYRVSLLMKREKRYCIDGDYWYWVGRKRNPLPVELIERPYCQPVKRIRSDKLLVWVNAELEYRQAHPHAKATMDLQKAREFLEKLNKTLDK